MIVIPVESVLIELDDNLGNLDIGLFGSHQVSFLWPLPLDQEEQLTGLIGGSDDFLWLQVPGKSSWSILWAFTSTWFQYLRFLHYTLYYRVPLSTLAALASFSFPPAVDFLFVDVDLAAELVFDSKS